MKEGDVLIVDRPQADGMWKTRPTVYLRSMPPFGDVLVCGVSTQLRHKVDGFDETVELTDTDFPSSGLKQTSIIRLGFLAVVTKKDIRGTIGSLSAERHQLLLSRLSKHLSP